MSSFAEIRTYEIFKNCSDEFVTRLSQFAAHQTVAHGTAIISEGDLNDRLRILAHGSVEVRVNNERVATLSTPGDLMGEISALAGRAVTASLIALSDCSFYEIMATELNSQIKTAPNDFGYQLYAVLSQQLADKIINTNEKARQFEIANRTLVDINKNLDLKVQERTDATFKQLAELKTSLMPLKELLAEIASRGAPVEEAYAHVANATDMLHAITEQFSTERSIRSRRVVVAEPDRKQQTIARMALGGTGAALEATSSGEDCLAALKQSEADLVFVSASIASSVPEILKVAGAPRVVYMVGPDLTHEMVDLRKLGPGLKNIVSRHTTDRAFTVRNMATTVTKLISKDLFGLEKYLMWGVQTQSHVVTSSGDRSDLIARMEEHLRSLGVRSAIIDRAAAVAEEILMNAIYDAPSDKGIHHYSHLPRTMKVILKGREHAQFRFAADGMFAAISVSDPFGGFKIETLLDYLERNLKSKGEDIQSEGKGGAGRGLQQILAQSDLVVFNVRPGSQTEVVALFNLDPNVKDDTPRSFHFFSES